MSLVNSETIIFSANGDLHISLSNAGHAQLAIAEESYCSYRIHDLESCLSRLLTEVWDTELMKQIARIEASGLKPSFPSLNHRKPQMREIYRQRIETQYQGLSIDEVVAITSKGWKSFFVKLDEAGLESLNHCQFQAEFNSAASDLAMDKQMIDHQIKKQVYGWVN